jgi:predicted nucleic acid-binding protein
LLLTEVTLLAPDLIVSELGSIFREKVLSGEMSLDDCEEALEITLERVILMPAEETFSLAVELATSSTSSFYDCLYLAFARGLDCQFVTNDERFIRRMQEHHQEYLIALRDKPV